MLTFEDACRIVDACAYEQMIARQADRDWPAEGYAETDDAEVQARVAANQNSTGEA